MKTKLVIKRAFIQTMDRENTETLYKQLQIMRHASAQFIRATKRANLLLTLDNLVLKVQHLKLAYLAEIRRGNSHATVERIDRRYGLNAVSLPINITHEDRLQIMQRLKHAVQNQRRANRRTNDPLANRPINRILREYQSTILEKAKRPDDTSEHVGIEIECVLPENADINALLPFAKWVNVGTDGSIRHNDNEKGQEIRVCMKREEIRTILPGIIAALKTIGATVNKSCGLHVHLDQRNNTEPEKTFQKLVRSLGLLYTIVPKSRRENTYCKRNRHSGFSTRDRYKAINSLAFLRYNTLEIRLFGGTLNTEKVIHWIEVLEAISHGEMINRCPKNFDTARKYWPQLTDANVAWLKERQAQFAPLNQAALVNESDDDARVNDGLRFAENEDDDNVEIHEDDLVEEVA